ncbi:dolichol kinase, partial [Oleoguttula sp. CCFEE 5521]
MDGQSVRSAPTWEGFLEAPGALPSEILVMLYPLHQALMQPLHYLTTTSLLMTELHLLSVTLINLLLFASTPQTTIIEACPWVGGLPLFLCAKSVLHWNVTLARVPKWKLRHPRHTSRKRQSLIDSVTDLINLQRAAAALRPAREPTWSDADENEAIPHPREARTALSIDTKPPRKLQNDSTMQVPWSAVEHYAPLADLAFDGVPEGVRHARRATLSAVPTMNAPAVQKRTRSRSRPHSILWCLQLTPDQAAWRSWFYAGYLYAVIVALVLGPVRMYVSRAALAGQEPVGWALGYLLGQIPVFRSNIHMLSLDAWIPLSAGPISWSNFSLSMLLEMPLTRTTLGAANVRLLLIAYWALVLLLGLLTVFSLTAYVEVDTRRKVFHGTMVVMLLPSAFVDPCACALALSLILAVFLLLEVLRAGQVPPLGEAISRFVAPYVDGRDLRGPVVVSHIFLLIGCAVPLWFSLATALREGDGWELANDQRDVGMIAGVVCVGMGDAAASLVGRRYGRHKWLWVGGKSLEGSGAFVVAVTAGLMFAKIWLVGGGWRDESTGREMIVVFGHSYGPAVRWTLSTIKAVFCACGASFMEAVLTGANDNVVVPIVLWLL